MSYETLSRPGDAAPPLSPSPTLRRFTVVARLPAALERLREVAQNLLWVWTPELRALFVRIDADLFEEVHGNALELLARVSQARLAALAADPGFLAHLDAAHATLREYLRAEGWFTRTYPEQSALRIAYFSMGYGLHESLPTHAGALGGRAGDHLKSASDLGLPLVGVGLAYGAAWPSEEGPRTDWRKLPATLALGSDRRRLLVHVDIADRIVHAQVWRVEVGRVPLLLLDTNIEENAPADRDLMLHGGDDERRIGQEVLLGIGGVHALAALGLAPTVCHMNGGQAAFVALERIARLMRDRGASFEVANAASTAGNVFTIQPVGDDTFDLPLVLRHLEPQRAALGISEEALLDLGRERPGDRNSRFSMAVLAMRSADRCSASSEAARRAWQGLWPDLPEHEVPIAEVTVGVHVPSWISADLSALYTRYLGSRWAESTDDPAVWARVAEIPDGELWNVHEHRRHRLVSLVRSWVGDADVLDPRALTIGFATPGQVSALFADLARVQRLLGVPERPVQLIVARPARDEGGEESARELVRASRQAGLGERVVLLEAHDPRRARALAAGVDVWLAPHRGPRDAMGMKALANGGLEVAVLDAHDALERELVPLFFERDRAGLPRAWIARMKRSSARVPSFDSARVLKPYARDHYLPAAARAAELLEGDLAGAQELVAWQQRIRAAWPAVAVVDVDVARRARSEVRVGDDLEVEARVRLGELGPYDVAVEVYYGPTEGAHDLTRGALARMRVASANADGTYTFVGAIPTVESGSHAFSARVVPWNVALGQTRATSLVRWA